MILDAGLRLEARRRVDRPRVDHVDRSAHVVGTESARKHEPALDRGRVAEMVGVVLLPRQVGDRRHAFPVAQQHRVAAADGSLLTLVHLHEVAAVLLRLADEHRDGERGVGNVEHGGRAAGRALREDESEQVGAGIDRDVDVVLACQPADLDERPREQLAQLRRRIGRAHQRGADEDRVGTRQLGGRALRACVHAALGDDHAVARRTSDEAKLRVAVDREGGEVAGVDPDHRRAERDRAV